MTFSHRRARWSLTALAAAALTSSTLVEGMFSPAAAASAPSTRVDSTAHVEVDNSSADASVTVPGSSAGTVDDVDVRIDVQRDGDRCANPSPPDFFSHAHEMYYTLTSPAGTSVRLITPNTYYETRSNGVVSIVLDDEAPDPVGGPGPVAGTFRPVAPLSAFDGQDAAGDWTLTVGDNAPSDYTCHQGFALGINGADLTGPLGGPAPDTTAPTTTITGGPADGATVATAPEYSFEADEDATFQCAVDDGAYADCTSPSTVEVTGLDDGEHTFHVRATDTAQNTGDAQSRGFTLDTIGPVTTIDSGPADGDTVTTAPSYGFSSADSDVDHFECRVDDGAFATCTSPHQVDIYGLDDADHTFSVRAVDVRDNTGAAVTRGFILDAVDTDAPATTITSGPADGATVDTAPTYGFTSAAGDVARFECSLDGTSYSTCTSPYATDVEPGTYTFSVRAVDGSDNTGQAVSRTFTLRDVACDDAASVFYDTKADVRSAKDKLAAARESGNPKRIERAKERLAVAKDAKNGAKDDAIGACGVKPPPQG